MKLYENKSRISEQHVKADHQAMDRVRMVCGSHVRNVTKYFYVKSWESSGRVLNAVMDFEQAPGNGLNGSLMILQKF